MMALGALQALKDSGISVPEKCKIVGFDDITLSEICLSLIHIWMISPAGFGHLTIEKYIITALPIIKRM